MRRFGLLVLGLIYLTLSHRVLGQESWFVAVEGKSSGTGKINDPIDLVSALASGSTPMKAGDTLFIRGGVYEGVNFGVEFNGTEQKVCVVKPYNNEKVIIKGVPSDEKSGLAVFRNNGKFVHVYDLIITCAPQVRISREQASSPTDIPTIAGTVITDEGGKMINCIIHNASSTALNSPTTAVNAEYYGNIAFNNGWQEISNEGTRYFGHGHSLYFQNASGSRKLIESNILFKTYGYGVQFYSAGGSATEGSDILENIIFMSGTLTNEDGINGKYNFLIDSDRETVLENNHSYHKDVGTHFFVGYNSDGISVEINGNYLMNGNKGMFYNRFQNIKARNNTVVMPNRMTTGYGYSIAALNDPVSLPTGNYDIDYSTYYSDGAHFEGIGDFSKWQELKKVDNNGIYTSVTDFKSVPNKVKVIPNRYEAKRAHIVIYNHQLLSTVAVDVSNILSNGDPYWLYDVEDMRQPIQQGTYTGGSLQIATNQSTVFPVIGTEVYTEAAHSGDDFGAFLLIGREVNVPVDGMCNISIDSVEPESCYEELRVNYTLEGECNEDVRAVILNEENMEVISVGNYQSGAAINVPQLCLECEEGNYQVRLESDGAQASESFVYKPLSIRDCDPVPTTDKFAVHYYSPVEDEIKLQLKTKADGQVVMDSLLQAKKEENTDSIDIRGLEVGLYELILQYGERITSDTIEKIEAPLELEIINCTPEETYNFYELTYVSPQKVEVELSIVNEQGSDTLYTEVLRGAIGETITYEGNLTGFDPNQYRLILTDRITSDECLVSKLRPLEIIEFTPEETEDIVGITYYSPSVGNVDIIVKDADGLVEGTFTDASVIGEENRVDISLGSYDEGIYTVVFQEKDTEDSCKVIKLKTEPIRILAYSPNPTEDIVSISYYCPKVTNVDIVIKNANGIILDEYTEAAVEGDANRIDVSLGSYEAGNYAIILSEENSSDSCIVMKNDRLPISILDYSPNPTEDIVAITYYSPIVTEVSITVANANG
ncbi:hypothetical protein, partial [Carboxylicivirga linearis]